MGASSDTILAFSWGSGTKMRPFFEIVTPEVGASWAFLDRNLPGGIPFEWHYHPEYELVLTLNSLGHRYVGDDVDIYSDRDLVLIGPGVPHSWCSHAPIDESQPHVALVCWFTQEWVDNLSSGFPETAGIKALLAKAPQGVKFGEAAQRLATPLIQEMRSCGPARRFVLLLEVFNILLQDNGTRLLANLPHVPLSNLAGDDRMMRVLNYLHEHYSDQVKVDELADLACTSPSALHRMFRRHARDTIVNYLVRLRIGRACSMLIGTSKPVSVISSDVGYRSLSLFNRQFVRLKGLTPLQFRRHHVAQLKRATPIKLSMDRPRASTRRRNTAAQTEIVETSV